MSARPPRRGASAAAHSRMTGGTGLAPRRECETTELSYLIRQAAFDVLCGVRARADDEELLKDWALGEQHNSSIEALCGALKAPASAMALAVLLETKDERAVAAALSSNATAATTPSPKIRIGAEAYLASELADLDKAQRHRLATKWATTKWATAKKQQCKLSECGRMCEGGGRVVVRRRRGGAIGLKNQENLVREDGLAGMSTKRRGRPNLVDDDINEGLVKFCELLRQMKIPIYKHSAMLYFTTLIDGTELADHFTKDGLWNFGPLDHWYYRQFPALPGVSTGSQRPLDLHRARWQTSQNACTFYDHARREQLLDAGIAVLTGNEKIEVRAEHLLLSTDAFV